MNTIRKSIVLCLVTTLILAALAGCTKKAKDIDSLNAYTIGTQLIIENVGEESVDGCRIILKSKGREKEITYPDKILKRETKIFDISDDFSENYLKTNKLAISVEEYTTNNEREALKMQKEKRILIYKLCVCVVIYAFIVGFLIKKIVLKR